MLNGEQIEKVRQTLFTSGWNDVMGPALKARAHQALEALVLTPSERRGEFEDLSDDAIRARIREAEWMLNAWGNEIAVHDHNQRLEELDRQRANGEPVAQRT